MFSVEEITLMAMYGGKAIGKKDLLEKLRDIYPLLEDDEEEMKELVAGVIGKLEGISDGGFKKINFDLALDAEKANF